jgi:hypothetical protein
MEFGASVFVEEEELMAEYECICEECALNICGEENNEENVILAMGKRVRKNERIDASAL